MLVYLDTVICIYAVEGVPPFKARAQGRLAALLAAGDQPAISDLTWLESRIKPVRLGDAIGLAEMETFLTSSEMVRLPMPFAVYDAACRIRAVYNFKVADALHLAVAIQAGCGLFLTHDKRLIAFPEIPIEVLP